MKWFKSIQKNEEIYSIQKKIYIFIYRTGIIIINLHPSR